MVKRILDDYLYLARREHIKGDIVISLIIGAFMSGAAIYMLPQRHSVVGSIVTLVTTAITAFSILAGFNTATLTMFATSNSPVIQDLKNQYLEGKPRLKIEQLIAYFTWAIAAQLALLLVSVFVLLLLSGVTKEHCMVTTNLGLFALYVTLFFQTFGTSYAIVLSIRNVSIIYTFLVADGRR